MIRKQFNKLIGDKLLPVDIVLAPEWWNKNAGISFDRDFFFHPSRRVEDEQKMEKVLYEKWGKYGLGLMRDQRRPETGAVHLASGFLLSEMLGCDVEYTERHPPQVIPAKRENLDLDPGRAFKSPVFKKFESMLEKLKSRYGYLSGDVNWSGILNIALDIRAESIFTDMFMQPEATKTYLAKIASVIEIFTNGLASETSSTSISVNRNVRNLRKPLYLHSECSHTMISTEDYEKYLLPFDIEWSRKFRPFGVHYCGSDPHRYAKSFAKIPHLDFLDVGWGGDIKILRKYLPRTFLNIRLSPVELVNQSTKELRKLIMRLVHESGNPWLTGVCCINMDDKITDDKITAIFKTVEEVRNKFRKKDLSTKIAS